MSENKETIFSVITKLMDENIDIVSSDAASYQMLVNDILQMLPKALDDGSYIDNAKVIRQVSHHFEANEILVKIPQLVGKHLVAIHGSSCDLQRSFESIISEIDVLEYNNNVPHLILPISNDEEVSIYALTYCDKLVELSIDEFELIHQTLYKESIEITDLIKAFISYHPIKYTNEAYLFMPSHVQESNSFYSLLKAKIEKQIVIPCDTLNLYQVKKFQIAKTIYFLCNMEAYKSLEGNEIFSKVFLINDINMLETFLEKCNQLTVNTLLTLEIEKSLMDVHLFYERKLEELRNKIERFNRDIISISNEALKDEIQDYRSILREEINVFQTGLSEFDALYKKIVEEVDQFERRLFNVLDYDGKIDLLNTVAYSNSLLRVFFKHILANCFLEAQNDILKLDKLRYPYIDLCKGALKYKQGYDLSVSEIEHIKSMPNDRYQIAKIKLMLWKTLGLSAQELYELVPYLIPIETAEEYYYHGVFLMIENRNEEAVKRLFSALDLGVMRAHKTLIKLRKEVPKLINIETMAMYLNPEANYALANRYVKNNKKQADVYYKVAASQDHKGAIEYLALRLYHSYVGKSIEECQDTVIQKKIRNIINLYEYLNRHRGEEIYQLRMGLLYNKLEDYGRAFDILSNLEYQEAIYTCAEILEYGKGVAKNLSAARDLYSKIGGYKDSNERMNAILCNERAQEQQNTYSETRSYETTYSRSSSSDSSGCFVITATCSALQKEKSWTELSKLLKLRNSFIRMEGAESVAEYYRLGPMIVANIEREDAPETVYRNLWSTYIEPTLVKLCEGNMEAVRSIYISMCKMLCEKYKLPVKEDILEKYKIVTYKKM